MEAINKFKSFYEYRLFTTGWNSEKREPEEKEFDTVYFSAAQTQEQALRHAQSIWPFVTRVEPTHGIIQEDSEDD
jgi:hypothetical protein